MIPPRGKSRTPLLLLAAAALVLGVVATKLRPAHTPEQGDTPLTPAYDSNQADTQQRSDEGSMNQRMPPQGGSQGAPTYRQGPCFRYIVPPGWQVAEDGQFAVVLRAPDQRAITTMVGNVGLPSNYNPGQYLMDKLSQLGLQSLRFGQARPAKPVLGFPSAWEYDVEYYVNGVPCRGVARCSVAPNYDFCSMVMTWAASEASQWPSYASWLPEVAGQVEITNAAAFGASGIAQQNLQNSIALGEQARRNREYSQQQWNQVTNERDASQARNNDEFRQALGAVERYDNPYTNQPIELPSTNTVYWVNPTTGRIVGDPNPSFDPRTSTDSNWQPLKRTQ